MQREEEGGCTKLRAGSKRWGEEMDKNQEPSRKRNGEVRIPIEAIRNEGRKACEI